MNKSCKKYFAYNLVENKIFENYLNSILFQIQENLIRIQEIFSLQSNLRKSPELNGNVWKS